MMQIEDIIRANKLDLNLIKEKVINKFDVDETISEEMTEWYKGLIEKMKSENIIKSGHLGFVLQEIDKLNTFHKKLIESNDKDYQSYYSKAFPSIMELRRKTPGEEISEIEVSFNSLYLTLLMKLNKQDIAKETIKSIDLISNMIAFLTKKYMLNKNIQ